jgi:hypothetical protein
MFPSQMLSARRSTGDPMSLTRTFGLDGLWAFPGKRCFGSCAPVVLEVPPASARGGSRSRTGVALVREAARRPRRRVPGGSRSGDPARPRDSAGICGWLQGSATCTSASLPIQRGVPHPRGPNRRARGRSREATAKSVAPAPVMPNKRLTKRGLRLAGSSRGSAVVVESRFAADPRCWADAV